MWDLHWLACYCRLEKNLFLLLFSTGAPTTKERWTRGKHTNLFRLYMTQKTFIRKWRHTDVVKPDHFFTLGLMKSRKSWENVIGLKGHEVSVVNWGKLSRCCSFRFPWQPSHLRGRRLFSLGYVEGISHMSVSWPVLGEGQQVLQHKLLVKFLPLKIVNMSRDCILG